ncbi:L-seryl-tRNA(Sec) selenium transferase [Candidatus Poribacteria bacterium]|nr:L-seryl-tRNA(Sec) selenium transferase [Candidatus Poribacteria bacterium]
MAALSPAQQDALRRLPSVDAVLADPRLMDIADRYDHAYVVSQAREAQNGARQRILDAPDDPACPAASVVADAVLCVLNGSRLRICCVINATGTVTHTNLGRALLAEPAVEAMNMAARHYVNLEYDVEAGARGHRDAVIEDVLRRLTGAEAATVVNNNAAAVLLTLRVLAEGREVVVSRGELVEIGGSFRLPDVMEAAGVRLREVGTTNRTHATDYEDAIGPETALLLKVHPSNYRVEGFTGEVALPELVAIGRAGGVPVVEDLGSGALLDLRRWGLPPEPQVSESVAAGADIVTFSGDKLLGGPQAGLIVGKSDAVERIRRHPMMRALRVDKYAYAALAATLDIFETDARPELRLPMLEMMTRDVAELERYADACVERWSVLLAPQVNVARAESTAQVGSGAQPATRLPSVAVTLDADGTGPAPLAAMLRRLDPPVIARVENDMVWLDTRTILVRDREALDAAMASLADELRDPR